MGMARALFSSEQVKVFLELFIPKTVWTMLLTSDKEILPFLHCWHYGNQQSKKKSQDSQ